MKKCAFALIAICVLALSSIILARQNFVGEGVPFQCGNLTLVQTVQYSDDQVFQGSEYAVIVKTKNVGETTGQVSTNFLLIGPDGSKVDFGKGPEYYTLAPGQWHSFSRSHGFGCTNRPKGIYHLGIGTQPYPTNQAANYIYNTVELVNGTICPGFPQ